MSSSGVYDIRITGVPIRVPNCQELSVTQEG
jgi:hypothetical protein